LLSDISNIHNVFHVLVTAGPVNHLLPVVPGTTVTSKEVSVMDRPVANFFEGAKHSNLLAVLPGMEIK
jgi:hypothetical protein